MRISSTKTYSYHRDLYHRLEIISMIFIFEGIKIKNRQSICKRKALKKYAIKDKRHFVYQKA